MVSSLSILSFDGYYEIDDDTYLSSSCFNGLVCISKKSGEIKVLKKFTVGPVFSRLLHHKIIKYNDELIFIPNYSHGVHIFNIESKEIDYVLVKKDKWENYRCVDAIVWNGKLWMIMTYIENAIVSMDLDSHEIEYHSDVYSPLKSILTNANEKVFWTELYKQDYMLYGAVDNKGYVAQINIKDLSMRLIKIDPENHFVDIALSRNKLFMTEYKSKDIVVFDMNSGNHYKIKTKNLNDCTCNEDMYYSNIVSNNDRVFVIPNCGYDIWEVMDNGLLSYSKLPEGFKDIKEDFRSTWKRFYCTDFKGNIIELYPNRSNMMIRIDTNNGSCVGHVFDMSPKWLDEEYQIEYVDEYIKECVDNGSAALEWDGVDFNDWIRALNRMDRKVHKSENFIVGKEIYKCIVDTQKR